MKCSFHAYLFSALSCLLLLTSGHARKSETGFLNRTVAASGSSYHYQVYVPANWDKHKKWPVLLFLHGAGERGEDGLLQADVGIGHAIRTRAAEFQFIVVMPQCWPNKLWTDPDMQAQALTALEQSIKEFHGDRDRVYLSGLSMGGYGTWDLAAKYPGKFAALAVICGGIRGPQHFPELHVSLVDDPKITDPYAETGRRIGKTPVWIFHGDADPAVPVEESRKMVEALRAVNTNVRYTEYPGVGHNSWDKAYAEPEFVPWLLAQHK
ncbi:MAG TPA: PHB depolymerase family esterase [Terriglobales bacterium]|nr:PHB depolymerase family esterase [Terriglobales bacterium]